MNCTSVTPGWYCAGEAGHDGPCAAWPPCFFCGYLGPGLEPYPDLNSICQQCIKDYIAASGVPQPNQPTTNLLIHERDTIWGTIKSVWQGRHKR